MDEKHEKVINNLIEILSSHTKHSEMSQSEEQTSNYQIPDGDMPQVTDVQYSVDNEPNHIMGYKEKTKYYCSDHDSEPICNWIKE